MARVLIADDEESVRVSLSRVLRREGYDVDEATDGEEAVRLATDAEYALIMLDVRMPQLDGFEACRRIRAVRPAAAILILTGLDGELDAVTGLDAGADDYVSKPFRAAELLARVRAHVRRTTGEDELIAGDVRVSRASRRAWHAEAELRLSRKEFDLLAFLVENAGRIVTRRQTMAAVWGGEWFGSPKALDMVVLELRRKLGDEAAAPRHVKTVRGIGLRFEA